MDRRLILPGVESASAVVAVMESSSPVSTVTLHHNPRNWSKRKKQWVLTIVVLYTFVVYSGASIVTPAASLVMAKYKVSHE